MAPAAFVIIECEDVGISHVMWKLTFPLTEAKDLAQLDDEDLFAALQGSDSVFPELFSGSKIVQRHTKLFVDWFCVEFIQRGQALGDIHGIFSGHVLPGK